MSTPYLPPDARIRKSWIEFGCHVPPEADYKAIVLKDFAKWAGIKVFVETGTWHGHTTESVQSLFEQVYTIELAPELAANARRRFADQPHITVIEGDSGRCLPDLLAKIDQRCLFWLDAHWCGPETGGTFLSSAIMPELEAILMHKVEDHVVLIDDARYFVGAFGYPTVEEIRRLVLSHRPDFVFDVAMDSIRFYPRQLHA